MKVLFSVVAVLLLIPAVSAQSDAIPQGEGGIYTEVQAIRGQALYYQHCLACHGEMMNGVDQAPPLAGPQFSSIWQGESLWALVERIDAMPPDKASTLPRQAAVDLLAYMLWYNGLPLGTAELGTGRDELAGMTFETPPPGG